MDEPLTTPTYIGSLFAGYQLPQPMKGRRPNERGELLKYFSQQLNRTIPFVATKLTRFQLADLYYIKSDCDQAAARGIPWGAAFYTSLKVK